jgi:hypothetical protein
MCLVDPLRVLVQLVLCGVLLAETPDSAPSSAAQIAFGGMACLMLILSVLCLWLPIDPKLRVPRVKCSVASMLLFPSYCHLSLAELIGKLLGFADVLFIDWMLIAGYSHAWVSGFFYSMAAIGACAIFVCCRAIARLNVGARPAIVAMALLIFPPTTLGALVICSSPSLGPELTSVFLGVAMLLGALKRVATSLLRTFCLPSRWKYVAFQAHSALALHTCEALSPLFIVGLGAALRVDVSIIDTRSEVFAQSYLQVTLPFALLQLLVHIATLRPLLREGVIKYWPNPWRIKSECAQDSRHQVALNNQEMLEETSRRFDLAAGAATDGAHVEMADIHATLNQFVQDHGHVGQPQA